MHQVDTSAPTGQGQDWPGTSESLTSDRSRGFTERLAHAQGLPLPATVAPFIRVELMAGGAPKTSASASTNSTDAPGVIDPWHASHEVGGQVVPTAPAALTGQARKLHSMEGVALVPVEGQGWGQLLPFDTGSALLNRGAGALSRALQDPQSPSLFAPARKQVTRPMLLAAALGAADDDEVGQDLQGGSSAVQTASEGQNAARYENHVSDGDISFAAELADTGSTVATKASRAGSTGQGFPADDVLMLTKQLLSKTMESGRAPNRARASRSPSRPGTVSSRGGRSEFSFASHTASTASDDVLLISDGFNLFDPIEEQMQRAMSRPSDSRQEQQQ